MRIETERKVRRWREQRWLLDQVIQSRGIDWDQGRTGKILRNCGPGVQNDLQEICGRIQKFVDIPREFSRAAARREEQARADIVGLEIWKVAQDFFSADLTRKHLEDVTDANAQPADARPAAALTWRLSNPQ